MPKSFAYNKIKGTKVTRCPRRVISVVCEHDCEIHPSQVDSNFSISKLNRWTICISNTTDSGKWSEETETGESIISFWEKLYETVKGRKSVYIIVPSVNEFMAVLHGYAELTIGNIWIPQISQPKEESYYGSDKSKQQRAGYFVIGGPTEIINGRLCKTQCHILSVTNYGRIETAKLIEQYFQEYKDGCNTITGADRFILRSRFACIAIARWYTGMIDLWKHHDCGIWGDTAAQLSHGMYRRKYADGSVVRHNNIGAHILERAALFGGRAEIYLHKEINDKLYRIDVRSMYPYILATRDCPASIELYGGECSVQYMRELLETHTAIARVLVESNSDEIPLRYSIGGGFQKYVVNGQYKQLYIPKITRTMFPIGQYTTTLIGRELRNAIDSGAIKRIFEHSLYRRTSNFRGFMTELLNARMECKRTGDVQQEQFYKLLANSFAGKFARKPGGWKTDHRFQPVEAWETWPEFDHVLNKPVKCRAIGFVPQVWIEYTNKPSGCPVILAWLTAEGRAFLQEIVTMLPPLSVVATDTDGLWINQSGYDKLIQLGEMQRDEPGQLRVINTVSSAKFWTPRHYRVDGKYVMSGFGDGFQVNTDGTITDYSCTGLYPTDGCDGPQGYKFTYRRSDISQLRDYNRAYRKDGTTIPHIINYNSGLVEQQKECEEIPRQLLLFDD